MINIFFATTMIAISSCATAASVVECAPPPSPVASGMLLPLGSGDLLLAGGNRWDAGVKTWSDHSDRYDVDINAWEPGPVLPASRGAGAAILVNGTQLLIGGQQDEHIHADVLVLKTDNGLNWQLLDETPFQFAYGSAATMDDRFYVVGGVAKANDFTQGDNEFWCGQWINDSITWSKKPSFPGDGVSLTTAAAWESEMYVFGGLTSAGVNTDQSFAYSESGGWRPLPPMPMPMRGVTAVSIPEGIVLLGGYSTDFVEQIWLYNPIDATYINIGELPTGVAFGSAIRIESTIYFAGGEDAPKQRYAGLVRIDLESISRN